MDYDHLGKRGSEVIRSDWHFEHFSQRSPLESCEESLGDGDSEFFLCPMLVTRWRNIFLKSYFASFSDLWNVYGECENFAVLKGHTGAVMELHFSLDGR